MSNWSDFENTAYKYLKTNYDGYVNEFIKYGDSDSNYADILVKSNFDDFWIEVKMPLAQAGQFVLIPDIVNSHFKYSEKNKTDLNQYSSQIISEMNKRFDELFNPGAKGVTLNFNDDYFYDWIIDYYKSKGVEFIITFKDEFVIFPLNMIKSYFNVVAKYRVKKSGSASVKSSKEKIKIKSWVEKNFIEIHWIDNQSNLELKSTENLQKVKFTIDDREYMFASKPNGNYEVRRLSQTNNANVIFEIKLKNDILISNKDFLNKINF